MSIKHYIPGIVLICFIFVCWSCGEKKHLNETSFTKADSLTDTYLAMQDDILRAWNMMIQDDNIKIKAMHTLAHQLMVFNTTNKDELIALEKRLEQLAHLRYSQKTMENEDIIEEYDFASQSLISELTAIAESRPEFTANASLQKLVDEITMADQRINTYRAEYDSIAAAYNTFLEQNKDYLHEIDRTCSFNKKPLFQMEEQE